MLCMVNCHLYANACVYALRIVSTMYNIYNVSRLFHTVAMCALRLYGHNKRKAK